MYNPNVLQRESRYSAGVDLDDYNICLVTTAPDRRVDGDVYVTLFAWPPFTINAEDAVLYVV